MNGDGGKTVRLYQWWANCGSPTYFVRLF